MNGVVKLVVALLAVALLASMASDSFGQMEMKSAKI